MSKFTIVARTPYDADYSSADYGLSCPEPSLAKQSFADECDINNIVSRWLKTGSVGPSLDVKSGDFLDASSVPDYHTAMNIVLDAQARFNALPSAVRDRFQNDPGQLLNFVEDSSNLAEAIALGLVPAPAVGVASAPQHAGDATPTATLEPTPASSVVPPKGGLGGLAQFTT